MFGPLLLFAFVQSSTALISKLNDSDYNRMPPLYHLDEYEECFNEPDAMYCYGEFTLVSDESSELLTTIQEFSEYFKHFNHTLIRHGYCMQQTCNEFYNISGSDLDLRWSFEACSNKTIYNKYKLKTRLTDEFDCSKRDRDLPIDNLDILVGVVCILIIMANLIGSICDYYLAEGKERGGLQFLYFFSISRNWKKFVAPAGELRDPRIKTLKGIHGIRAINICLVVITHANFASGIFLVNPKILEDWYENIFFQMILNGPVMMQSFFLVSSFLLVYNWLVDSEKRPFSWSMLPQQIIVRWMRLTPSYAVTIGLTATWFTKLASGGPVWMKVIYYEARDCRRNWWKHILYISNYFDRSNCMVQTWYLAADTQLYIFAVIILLLCRSNLTRKVVLSLLFVVGIIVPILHTYYQELDGVLISTPGEILNLFIGNPTFEKVYSKGHTNLIGCIIGMALGYIIYNWQKAGGNPKQFKKYRHLYWSLFLVSGVVYSSGYIFYAYTALPMYVHLLYAGLQKPAFGIIMATIIAGVVIQFEGFYRPFLEWRPFIFISRLSYSMFLLHILFIRVEVASNLMSLQRITLVGGLLRCLTILTGVIIVAFIFCLMVEIPFANLVNSVFKRPHTKEQNTEAVKETKKIEDENATDMSQTKTEDGTIVVKMGTRI